MHLIPARIKDEALVAEIDQLAGDEEHFYLWWLGQSGYLLTYKGQRILIDPYLSDSLTEKYASTNKPHVRMSERVVDPNLLKNICVVTSSHNHTDHLDAFTLEPIINNNPGIQFIIPEANRKFVAERVKCSEGFPIGLNVGEQVTTGLFTFHGIAAAHNTIERDEHGRCRFMGYVIRFGKWTIYHSGDTLLYEGMTEELNSYAIDVALLPINGNDLTRGVAGNLDIKEAAELGRSIGAGVVIPCHYDMFTFNTADVNAFAHYADSIGQRYIILPPGGCFASSQL